MPSINVNIRGHCRHSSHDKFEIPCYPCNVGGKRQRTLHRSSKSYTVKHYLTVAAKSGGNSGVPKSPKSSASSRRDVLSLLASLAVVKHLSWPGKALSDGGSSLLEKEISEFSLSNGLHFIVLERRTAPIVSCHTHANVGAFNEVDGKTGLAHMLEHEAFKGSDRIGTTNWSKEKPLLEAQDEVFYEWRQAKISGDLNASVKYNQQLLDLQNQAGQYAVGNEYGARFTQAGSLGLNASTSHDATKYHVSLPSNKLELWFALEAERFQASVFRELYSEKRVVLEERRARVDNSPLGKYLEEFNALKFGNNYRRPVIGYQQDIENFGRQEVLDFFQRHYVPSKLTISVVGDTDTNEVYKLAEKYFGGWSPSFKPLQSTDELADLPVKPPNYDQTIFEKASSAGPILVKGYYRGDINSEDAFIMEVIDDVLTGGRTARFDKSLIQTGKLVAANFNASSPGGKYSCACGIFAVPSKGVNLDETNTMITQQLTDLASHGIEDWELRRIRKATKVDTLEAIRMNTSMAASLAATHALTGSWKTLLSDLQKVEDLKSDQVRDAAARIFTEDNSFTGYITTKAPNLKEQFGVGKL